MTLCAPQNIKTMILIDAARTIGTVNGSMADGSTADADGRVAPVSVKAVTMATMAKSLIEAFDRVAPQNIKTMIRRIAMDILAVTERVDAVVPVGALSIIRLLLLFSGFKNRSLSRRERNHPRKLEMGTLMTSVHPWMSAK